RDSKQGKNSAEFGLEPAARSLKYFKAGTGQECYDHCAYGQHSPREYADINLRDMPADWLGVTNHHEAGEQARRDPAENSIAQVTIKVLHASCRCQDRHRGNDDRQRTEDPDCVQPVEEFGVNLAVEDVMNKNIRVVVRPAFRNVFVPDHLLLDCSGQQIGRSESAAASKT